MANCTFCGKPAGWFRSEHSDCRTADTAAKAKIERERQELVAQGVAQMAAWTADVASTLANAGDLLALEARMLDAIASGAMDHAQYRAVVTEGWRTAATRALEDGLIDENEDDTLTRALERLPIDPKDAARDGLLERVGKLSTLRVVLSGAELSSVREVELFFWFSPPKSPRHKPSRTRYRMTREEAAERMPTAWPDLSDRMVIHKPETPEEHHQAFLAMQGQRGIYRPDEKKDPLQPEPEGANRG